VAAGNAVFSSVSGIFGHAASLCFSCFRRMFQVFHLDVAYVVMAIHACSSVCFKYFRCFQIYVASVSSGRCKVDLDVAYITLVNTHVLRACFKCFIYFRTYVINVYLNVAYVTSVCYECFIYFCGML
jgi:hypothetical protein